MERLSIEYVNIEDLKAYEKNAKVHTEQQIQEIRNSIERFGMNDPIAVWKDNVIIEGHGRLLACKELGMEQVPIIRLDELSDGERRAYMLAHNKLTMNTGFDDVILGEELEELIGDVDLSGIGFSDFEITMLTSDFEPEPYDDHEYESYTEHSDEFLARKRVIITFTEENEDKVLKLLGLQELTNVIYPIEELA